MNLYFIAHHDSVGDNQDWFVQAESPTDAIAHWNAYRDTAEFEMPDAVFLVPPIDISKGNCVLEWRQDVESVA